MSEPLNVRDYERLAAERVPPERWCYFEGGAGDEVTLRENLLAFRRWRLRPRMLVDVDRVTTETMVLGTRVSMPLLVAPVAYQGLLDPEGEVATARAAEAAGTILCVSTVTSRSHRELAVAAPGLARWAQLYVLRDEGRSRAMLDEARESGCTAVVLTVDVPWLGRRERDLRLGFEIPAELPQPYMQREESASQNPLEQFLAFSPQLTWRDLERLGEMARLPLLVKGILTREDAVLACEHGAAGIIVSNHGGRQLDGVAASLDALPAVVEAVAGRVPVLLDGGIRRGTDVVKALALGATAVLAGRAPIYGLAARGEEGVRHVLSLLRDEVELALALLGCTSVEQVAPGHVEPAVPYDLPA